MRSFVNHFGNGETADFLVVATALVRRSSLDASLQMDEQSSSPSDFVI